MNLIIAQTETVKLITSASGSIHYIINYGDENTLDGYKDNVSEDIITTATTTTVLTAPATNFRRKVYQVSIFNNGVSNTVTLLKSASSDYIFHKCTLEEGESLKIIGDVINVFDNTGKKKDNNNFTSTLNSTSTLLNSGVTFTGTSEDVSKYNSIVLASKTDQDGSLFIDFSNDGTNWDSTLTFLTTASTNEVHRLTITRKYIRVRFTNTSASNQTYLRLQTTLGSQTQLTSGLNSQIQQDADALTVRTIDPEIAMSRGLFEGYSIIQKFGRNGDIDTGSVPEDIWNGGGAYAGFPTGSPEEFQVFSSSASDTGVLTFTYLASTTSTSWQTATVTLNGTTPVDTGVTGYRMHTCQYNTGASTTFNVGTITVRHKVTTANIFCVMPIGRSQTNVAAYTIPFGYTGYIRRLFCRVIGSTSGIVDGALWIRGSGMSPRLRRPFTSATADAFEELPYGGIAISSQSDIMVRISSASANNLDVIAGYDLILIKN